MTSKTFHIHAFAGWRSVESSSATLLSTFLILPTGRWGRLGRKVHAPKSQSYAGRRHAPSSAPTSPAGETARGGLGQTGPLRCHPLLRQPGLGSGVPSRSLVAASLLLNTVQEVGRGRRFGTFFLNSANQVTPDNESLIFMQVRAAASAASL